MVKTMNDVFDQANELLEYTRELRRDLHQHPELGYQEVRTAGIVARELGQLGLEVTTGVAETGVVALLEGSQPGPVALLRFDMDALPIQEETGAEFSSLNPGVMHACGHDGHVAIGLTVARILHERREQIKGAVKLVFQPAEEGQGGAQRMMEAGVLNLPQVDYTLALHIWNERPVGWVGVTTGPLMAGADIFDVRINGKGGHGAQPQESVDPVVAAAQIISGLQTIVSRNISPMDTAVVSVCRLRAGEAFNVIPQFVEFGGTLRTFEPAVREKVVERFSSLISTMAESFGCKAVVNVQRLTPAVHNDPAVTARVMQAVQGIPGLQVQSGYRTMISEDMAYLMEKIPGCYILVGSANAEKGLNFGHHHPRFNFDETVLPNAVAVMVSAALELLK
jgi:amidohydrolase